MTNKLAPGTRLGTVEVVYRGKHEPLPYPLEDEDTPEHARCPFCGNAGQLDLMDTDPPIFWVDCTRNVEAGTDESCIAGPGRSTPEAAWQAWDTRAASADVTALFDMVLKQLEVYHMMMLLDDEDEHLTMDACEARAAEYVQVFRDKMLALVTR